MTVGGMIATTALLPIIYLTINTQYNVEACLFCFKLCIVNKLLVKLAKFFVKDSDRCIFNIPEANRKRVYTLRPQNTYILYHKFSTMELFHAISLPYL